MYLLALKENCKSNLILNGIREVRHLFQKLRLGIHINLKEKYASFMAYTFLQAYTEGHFDNRLNFQKHECFNFSQFMSYFLICLHIECTFGFISFHEVTNNFYHVVS